jgi:hypothetical protein
MYWDFPKRTKKVPTTEARMETPPMRSGKIIAGEPGQ